MEGRAQFITLQFPDNITLIVNNVYTARSSSVRTPMWKRLSETNFPIDHVIVEGISTTSKRQTVEESLGSAKCIGRRQLHGITRDAL
jgi:hypothetical protein